MHQKKKMITFCESINFFLIIKKNKKTKKQKNKKTKKLDQICFILGSYYNIKKKQKMYQKKIFIEFLLNNLLFQFLIIEFSYYFLK